MFTSAGLIVSFPAREFDRIPVTAGVGNLDQLDLSRCSTELIEAVNLLSQVCGHSTTPSFYCAGPEAFTHGLPLDWLHERVGAVSDHLSISDGACVRFIPGMVNHVFFYGL